MKNKSADIAAFEWAIKGEKKTSLKVMLALSYDIYMMKMNMYAERTIPFFILNDESS